MPKLTATITANSYIIDFKQDGRMIGTAALRKSNGWFYATNASSPEVQKIMGRLFDASIPVLNENGEPNTGTFEV